MNFTFIIFDLDGTLTDSRKGIYNSLHYAIDRLGLKTPPEETLSSFIGPSLQKSFKSFFELDDQNTDLAVKLFREYYTEKGWRENELYPGITELFVQLKSQNKKIFVATSKYEKYAAKILEHFELDKFLSGLKGADYSGTLSKTELISEILRTNNLTHSKAVMVGDTHFDVHAAKECSIASIAVGYGFGKKEELIKFKPDFFVENVSELLDLLIHQKQNTFSL